ncbi:MAG: biotin transporter BioY [Candidatus Omnitrophota bacterium]
MESVIKKEIVCDNKKICRFLAVSIFVLLTALSAFVRIPLPFTPVPFTLQTFFVLLSGALLGRKLGGISQAGYMVLGLTGLQVFTGSGSGSLYLLGPTGGYLVGFILASFFTGKLFTGKNLSRKYIFFVFLCADFILLCSGALWLKAYMGCSLAQAFLSGFLPFVFGDILKAVFAVFVFCKTHSRVKEFIC